MIGFIWDERKNEVNIVKHGFDFSDAEVVFQSKLLVRQDNRKNYGEKRFYGVGEIRGDLVVIVFTHRESDIRIISLRKASRKERKAYEEALKNI